MPMRQREDIPVGQLQLSELVFRFQDEIRQFQQPGCSSGCTSHMARLGRTLVLRDQATPAIHYRLQNVFCRKPGCRTCRDGRGHGPYWYAYRYENGRTKTIYLGKAGLGEKKRERVTARGRQAEPRTEEQKPAPASISYHLQKSYCGKERCRKCRDGGEGHGPYWYAYRTDGQGRTTRTYVGKVLPEGVTADGAVAKIGAKSGESQDASAPVR